MSLEADVVDALNVDPVVLSESLEAFMDVPPKRPSQFITVERTGGPVEMVRQVPLLAVQVWAESRYEASRLAEVVAGVLRSLVALPWVGRVNVSSIYNFPDPDGRQARYQIVAELVTV